MRTSTSITKRQREIVSMVAGGLSSQQIAEKIGVSKSNVDKTCYLLCLKFSFQSRYQLVAHLAKNNLLIETEG